MRKIALILLLLFFMPTSLVAVKHFKGIKTDVYQELMKSRVAQWKMNDDTNSTVVVDSSGNGYNGTAQQNTEDINAVGKINGALSFNGTNDYIDTNWAFLEWGNPVVIPDGGGLTISFWYKGTQDITRPIFSVKPGLFLDSLFQLIIDGMGRWYLDFIDLSDNSLSLATEDNDANVWIFGCVVVKKVSDTSASLYLYINTELRKSEENQLFDLVSLFQQLEDDGRTLKIGRNGDGAGFWYGSLDNVMIFDKAISQAEIDCLWNGGAGREE